ncbi:hypothetical protein [uncultured Psychroserpens sp.]|uniref:hypothetical protein n=1 Tax=uncultured Psychroserpens sp. TaxID=255436 RepID=UPI0026187ED3|nr:hypothetical protein [uncultured Psychroserpens sp.]
MKRIYISCLLFISLFFNCSYVSEDDVVEEIIIEGDLTYDNTIKTIIDNNCITCHNNPPVNDAPMSLLTYSDVSDAVENRGLIERISSDDLGFVMPFGGPKLPQNLIDLIIQWEAEGLIEN